jgi:long-chain acyl-CoA synthetase
LKYWPQGVSQTIEYPDVSLSEILRRAAKENPGKVAVVYYGSKLTYGQLDELADRFATALQGWGLGKGDRVAIYLPNTPQFVIAYYGILRAGGTVVCASALYKERELEHILNDSGARTLIAYDKLYPMVKAIRDHTSLRNVLTTSPRDYLPPILRTLAPLKGVKSYKYPDTLDFVEVLRKTPPNPRDVTAHPKDDVAVLGYTGGTTGVPKAAMLTHRNIVSNAAQVASWLPVQSTDVHLSALPFFHLYGQTVTMNVPVFTSTPMIIIPDPRDLTTLLKAIDRWKPTIFCGVPTLYIALLNRPDLSKHNLRSIRACMSGAAPLPLEVQKNWGTVSGGRLVEGFGLTETSPVSHCNPLDDMQKNRPGSIGIPLPDTEAKIVDLETGKDLPPGQSGELAIRGPQVMLGYWNKPEETKMVLQDGWFRTGDIAKMDADGYFYIVDRKKDMIDVGGLKVYPRDVEEVLYEHPAIQEAAVIGVPDPRRGETVKAFVVPKAGYEDKVTAEEITQFCKSKMASYKAPTMVVFRKELPKTPVGKILRRALKEEGPIAA